MAKNWSSSSLAVIGNRVRLPRPPPLCSTTPSPLFALLFSQSFFFSFSPEFLPSFLPIRYSSTTCCLLVFSKEYTCRKKPLVFPGFLWSLGFCFFCWFWGLLLLFHLLGCVLTEAADFEALSLGIFYRSRSLEEVGVVVVLFLKALPMCRVA